MTSVILLRQNSHLCMMGLFANTATARIKHLRPSASVAEIAEAEGMDVTQVRRVMRLTLLAPEVVERLVSSPDAVLEKVMRRPWPSSWNAQTQVLPGTFQG